jgi:diguanylate cyclase (GGDEF)-like protein
VEKYINKKEIIPTLFRAMYGIAIVYLIFLGRFGMPSERMEYAFVGEGLTLAVILLALFLPERLEAGSWLLFFIDTCAVLFGLWKFGGLNGWPVFLLPLLAVSAAFRFTAKVSFALTFFLAAAAFGATRMPGQDLPSYQFGMWAALMFLFCAVAVQYNSASGEQKYRMMYLDQEHTNSELEERVKDLEKKMQAQTIVDQVTGLKNFRYFRSRIEEEISRAHRKGYVFSLGLIEIDDMPEFTRVYGETESRKAAQKLSVFLKDIFRNTDLIGRYKENQFLVMMPETDARSSLIPMMRFKKKIDTYGFGPDHRYDFHISIGISCYPTDVEELGGLLSLAFGALKRSQQKGKGMITLASSMFKKGAGG